MQVTRGGQAVPRAFVRFSATAGTVQPDTTTTDERGDTRAMWIRAKGGDPVGISVSARIGTDVALAHIRLTPKAASTRPIALSLSSGSFQSWFEEGQLPRPVVVELLSAGKPITDHATCTTNRVAFRLRGAPASVNPDTVTAALVSERGSKPLKYVACTASTFWSLGKGIGDRELDIALVPGKDFTAEPRSRPLRAYSWARATPRFVAGLGRSRLKSYVGLKPATIRTLKVESIDATGAKITYDRPDTTARAAADSIDKATEYSAIAAVSIPIPIGTFRQWDNFSLTAGVDLAKPRDRFFVGGSVLRLLGRHVPVIEAVPLDFHVLLLFARQEELVGGQCTSESCRTDKHTRYQGVSLMLSADAQSLLTDLIGKLAPK